MKKFLITIAAYLLILSLLISGINALYLSKIPEDELDVARFDAMPDTIRICNLGSSHGRHGFDYSEVAETETFNFAFTAQSLTYDYRLLLHYQDRLTEGSLVFIPLSYFTFFGYDEAELDDFASKNKRYYHILPPKLVKEYSFISYLCTVPFPAVGAGTNIISALLNKNEPSEDDGIIRTVDMIDLEANVQSAYQRHLVQNRQDEEGNLILQENEVQAVYDIIDLCRSQKAVPILVTTPYLSEYTDRIKQNAPDFLPYFYSIVNQIANDTGTPYLDYAFDERFKDDHSLFSDCDHLNKTGATMFTKIILEDAAKYTSQ